MNKTELRLRPLEDGDIPRLTAWLYKDYIRQWYHDPEEWLKEVRERKGAFAFLRHFIVLDGDTPLGFCQYYDCFDAQEEWYEVTEPKTIYSIDYLIGEEAYLGKGWGTAIVGALVEAIRNLGHAKTILVQPEPENIPSNRALLANGFIFDEAKGYYRFSLVP
ncbi:GNAT family N-acetyltransferase [Breznakiella homolactica]|uniref:GNAT family N-acetyltransferase n=1 Tax=Breznakiella homolactica TaxID=2798577 RepID=A0A7T7XM05_9SPIR|nr:GNAT family N-acetyltransferase [Breznakiella homolactica]QQO08738.1 acetyltransferase [Breznakiella homolactica]